MIEVVTFDGNGALIDRAEAGTPEQAMRAARQLADDAKSTGIARAKLTVRFYTNGKLVFEGKGNKLGD